MQLPEVIFLLGDTLWGRLCLGCTNGPFNRHSALYHQSQIVGKKSAFQVAFYETLIIYTHKGANHEMENYLPTHVPNYTSRSN